MTGVRLLFTAYGVAVAVLIGIWSTTAQDSLAAEDRLAKSVDTQPAPATLSPAHRHFTDVVLVNQNGENMRLYSDLLKGKVVVMPAMEVIHGEQFSRKFWHFSMPASLHGVQFAFFPLVYDDHWILAVLGHPT